MNAGRVVMHRCAVAGVQATTADTTRSFARHSHDTFGVGVVWRGAQRSASGRGPVEARAGDVITVNPGEVHDGSPFDERGRAWRMLYFEPKLVHDVALELGAAVPSSVELERPVLRDEGFAACFERTFAAVATVPAVVSAGGRFDTLACEERLYALLAECVRRHTTVRLRASAGAAIDGMSASIRRAKARIDDDPCEPVTLAGLAFDAGLSRFQLLRGFARDTGLPPHAYLIQRRISLARRLIEQGMVLADAAAGAGFADQSHMTRAFVRAFGVTPAQYAGAVR
ncbi:AraC family transcriptional regulator [Trinickia dinghuensis]|uniref:AraC family transcriptional regulator n=1 Tax=Trinickia dinghuensis TaxID=2291023 RepID=A0A3D8K7E5_9BURK|nr:AraC family transcriptional regulator [Trinickia dinghuensis]RDV00805.1 AraC family transcriptional regulator [Trinickia dinghuensis]